MDLTWVEIYRGSRGDEGCPTDTTHPSKPHVSVAASSSTPATANPKRWAAEPFAEGAAMALLMSLAFARYNTLQTMRTHVRPHACTPSMVKATKMPRNARWHNLEASNHLTKLANASAYITSSRHNMRHKQIQLLKTRPASFPTVGSGGGVSRGGFRFRARNACAG